MGNTVARPNQTNTNNSKHSSYRFRKVFTLRSSVSPALRAFTAFKFVSVLILLASVVTGSFWAYNSLYDASAANTYIGTLTSTPSPAISISSPSTSLSADVSLDNFVSLNSTVSISTNYPTGYSLKINADSNSLQHTTNGNYKINATSGNFSTPSSLSADSWGFAIIQNSSSSASNTITNSFDNSYASPTINSKWAQLPTVATTIKSTNQAASSDPTTVYYGVNTNSDTLLASGRYTGTVTLTALADASEIPAPTTISISDNYDVVAGGKTVTITGTNFSVNGSSVTSAVKIGDNDCTDVKIYKDSDASAETLTCVVPASTNSATGSVNVVVTNWTGSATLSNGFAYVDPPVGTISTTANQKSTSQTATITCTSTTGVASYYWGTSSSPADSDYTGITSTTSYSTTKSVTSAGTYYLYCKDGNGIVSTATSQIYRSLTVYNMRETTTGTEGTYTTANYGQVNSYTYIIPNGTTITMSSNYTVPSYSSSAKYVGYATTAPSSSTAASIVSTSTSATKTITANTTLSFWFNRTTYTLTLNKGTGISSVSGAGTYRAGRSVSISASVTSEYTFSKWTVKSGNTPSSTTSASTTITITTTTSLTANATGPIADGMYMQDVTQEMCAKTPLYSASATTYTLVDSRDSSTYQVRRLADGNCWMTQNLRLINKTISSSNSNVSSSFTIPASSTSTGTTNGKWGTTNNANGINHTAVYYGDNTTYGAYYNWYTATAGSGTSSTTSNVYYSICPKSGSGNSRAVSWHLPSGSTSGEWKNLMVTSYGYEAVSGGNTDNPTRWGATPVNLPLSGFIQNGSRNSSTSSGYWWSSTADINYGGKAYYMSVYSDGYDGLLQVAYNNYENYGYSVRCVLTAAGS